MKVGEIEDFSPELEKKLGPAGMEALIAFVDNQEKAGDGGQWDGVSFEAGWSAARAAEAKLP